MKLVQDFAEANLHVGRLTTELEAAEREVERLRATAVASSGISTGVALAGIVRLLAQYGPPKSPIAAVKVIREITGCSLKAAADVVRNVQIPFEAPAPGQAPTATP